MTDFLEKLGTVDNNWVWHDVASETGDVVMANRFGLQQKATVDDEIVGRTYDLRSAYKQCVVSLETRNVLRVVVWDADRKTTMSSDHVFWDSMLCPSGVWFGKHLFEGQYGSMVRGNS